MVAHRLALALLIAPAFALVLAMGCGDTGESEAPDVDGQAGDAATGGMGGEPTASGGQGGESSTGGRAAASGGESSTGGLGGAGGIEGAGGQNGTGGGADHLEVSCAHPYSTVCKVFAGPVERVSQASQYCYTYEYPTVDVCPTLGVTGVCDFVDGDLSLRDIYYYDDEQDLANAQENCTEGLGSWSDTL